MSLLPDARRLMQNLKEHKRHWVGWRVEGWGVRASESDITVPVWIVIGLPSDGDAATGTESTRQVSSEGNTLHKHAVRRHSVDLSAAQ